jgi:signal transduction histidine kinase
MTESSPNSSHAPQPEQEAQLQQAAIADEGSTPFAGEVVVAEANSRILIVDDNEMNREVLLRRLRDYHTEIARDGREALEKVRAQPFDLVLLDIMMPAVDGYEVLRQMKSDDALKNIPVIMISALSEIGSVVRCIEMGAEDYLPKPFSPTLLRARVETCLERKRAHDREARLLAIAQENLVQLRRLEQQRDDLMHMIVHDLRSPLSSNLAGIEMVKMLGPLRDEQRECLQIALRSGHSLLGLINDLLDISRMEDGAPSLELLACSPDALIAVAAEQVAPLLREKQLQLTHQAEPDVPPVLADAAKLRRILVNLLSNAIKFTPHGGIISLNARRCNQHETQILFSVHDTGEGIPPEALDRIFEKFAQVENRRGGRQNSSGLGLTFCKLAVEAHGGRIWAQSTPGEGSTFLFTIPIAAGTTDSL